VTRPLHLWVAGAVERVVPRNDPQARAAAERPEAAVEGAAVWALEVAVDHQRQWRSEGRVGQQLAGGRWIRRLARVRPGDHREECQTEGADGYRRDRTAADVKEFCTKSGSQTLAGGAKGTPGDKGYAEIHEIQHAAE